jgi:hypothetical protein
MMNGQQEVLRLVSKAAWGKNSYLQTVSGTLKNEIDRYCVILDEALAESG